MSQNVSLFNSSWLPLDNKEIPILGKDLNDKFKWLGLEQIPN